MRSEVEILVDRAMKFGAPKEEAFCLSVSRMCCEQCKKSRIRKGECKGIWENKHLIDYERFSCEKLDKIEKG